jgi:hypothetical protein
MKTPKQIEDEVRYQFKMAEECFDEMMALPDGDKNTRYEAYIYQHRIDEALFRISGMLWVLDLFSDDIPLVGSHEQVNIVDKVP